MYIKHLLHLIFLWQNHLVNTDSHLLDNQKYKRQSSWPIFTQLLHYRLSCLLKIYKKSVFSQRIWRSIETESTKIKGRPTKSELNPVSSLSANRQKRLYQLEARNCRNSAEHDQNLMKPGEACGDLPHQIWAQSSKRFVWKYTKIAPPIKSQAPAGDR